MANLAADATDTDLATTNPSVLDADGRTLTLNMNESMRAFNLPAATAFTVVATPAGGTEAAGPPDATTPVTVTNRAAALNLGAPIAHNDTNVKVSYAAPTTGGKLQDRATNALPSFTNQAAVNNSTVPRICIDCVYRYAEGSSEELEVTAPELKTGATYPLQVATQSRNGTAGAPESVRITTPAFTGPHYTRSALSSADEDQTFTITVSRTNRDDGESTALVTVRGSGETDTTTLAAEFDAEDSSARVNHTVPDDDTTATGREIRIRISHVGRSTDNTYSVQWHTMDINNMMQ